MAEPTYEELKQWYQDWVLNLEGAMFRARDREDALEGEKKELKARIAREIRQAEEAEAKLAQWTWTVDKTNSLARENDLLKRQVHAALSDRDWWKGEYEMASKRLIELKRKIAEVDMVASDAVGQTAFYFRRETVRGKKPDDQTNQATSFKLRTENPWK